MSDINNINNYNLKSQLKNISKDSQIKKSDVKEEKPLFKTQMQEDTEFSYHSELTELPVEKAKTLNEKLMALFNAKKEQAVVEETPVEPENTETVAPAEPTAAEETTEATEVTADAELPATSSEATITKAPETIPKDDDTIPKNYTSQDSQIDKFEKEKPLLQEDTEFSYLTELTQLPAEKAKTLHEKLMALFNAGGDEERKILPEEET